MITLRRKSTDGGLPANCPPDSQVGQAVRISTVELGLASVVPVDPTDPAQMPAYGLIVRKMTPTRCYVQRWGDVQLPSGNLEPGKVCYVGLDAAVTTTQPSAEESPSGIVVLQTLGLATGPSAVDFNPSTATLEISA